MIKVLFDHQIFSLQVYGGISRYFANIIEKCETNLELTVTCELLYSINYYYKDDLPSFKKSIFKLLTRKKSGIYQKNKKYSKHLIKQGNYDVFHPTYYDTYYLSYLKKPLVITIHDMIHERFPQFFPIDDPISEQKKTLANAADRIIAISETTKADIIKYLGIAEEKIKVIPHGIDNDVLEYEEAKGLPERYLLFVGSRAGYKNFSLVMEAFAQLIKTDKSLHLVVAGSSFTEEETALLNEQNILGNTIQLAATDKQLNTLYKNAICFIFPSKYEGFGIPILEAFKNNCPVLLSNCSCFPEIAGDAALYFDAESKQSLIDKVSLIQESVSLKKDLIAAGVLKLQSYTLDKCMEATIDLYKEIIQHRTH
ncbi:glycosyltransferase family 1 protein [Pedobacter sp. ASV1-7]|uniref:glycosyltransferase family 4 protein n=1 Tax=Pedobacter sp. ASV1-7 TaxID=3145237 RepID=UPI0032E8CF2E